MEKQKKQRNWFDCIILGIVKLIISLAIVVIMLMSLSSLQFNVSFSVNNSVPNGKKKGNVVVNMATKAYKTYASVKKVIN